MTADLRAKLKDWLAIIGTIGGALMIVGGTIAMSAIQPIMSAQESQGARITVIETQGSVPNQRALREIRDSLNTMRREQAVMRYLQCQTAPARFDSHCANVERPR